MSITFCQPCLAILRQIRAKPKKGGGQHHKTLTDLCDAADDGCHICKRLRRRFLRSGETDPAVLRSGGDEYFYQDNRSPATESQPTGKSPRRKKVIYFEIRSPYRGQRRHSVPLEIVAVPPVEDGLQDRIFPSTVNTGSDGSMALATQWLQTCVARHTTCNRSRLAEDKDWKPSRLLYVGDEEAQDLRLCLATALPGQVTYTTLSHCWGPDPKRLNLMTENLASWIERIPEEDMTRTFKDAIKVTRRLHVQYLWIDSLCIIQNSKADWLHESSLMGNVYKYSFCNIAATASADDHGGCFYDRDPVFDLPTRVDLADLEIGSPDESPGNGERGQNQLYGLCDLYWNDQWIQDVSDSPLFKRAWVQQERILPPRLLHFAKTQLYWECNESAACEAYPSGMSTENTMLQKHFKAPNPFNLVLGFSKESEEADAPKDAVPGTLQERNYKLWAEVVQDYAKTNLTKEGDKLIAISGIAREMQPLMQSRYLAGHWESDLIRQLAWFQPRGGKPRIYCAPSWSWASTKAGPSALRFPSYDHPDDFHPLADVVNAHIDPEGDDGFGPVKAGYLDILGQLFPMEITDQSDPPLVERKVLKAGIKRHSISLNYERDVAAILEGPLYCMPLFLSVPISGRLAPFSGGVEFKSLVLQQCDDLPNVYRRVGLASPRSYDGTFEVKDPFFKLLGKLEGPDYTFSRNTTGLTSIRLI